MGVHLISGDDESLVLTGLTEVVHRLVGDGDRSLMVDDFDGLEYEIRSVVDAAQTPPFLTECRVVIARGIGRFTADDVAPLITYLADPLPSTELVLVAGGGRVVKGLVDAAKRGGALVIDTAPPSRAKDRSLWVEQQFATSSLKLDGPALHAVGSWMGEDAGRLQGLIETLVSAFGTAQKLHLADVRPFLGDAGGVPPWDLTDAIDRGDTVVSLALLHRMMGQGDRHPLQVMAILHGHYTKLLKLDGSNARDEATAAQVLGIKAGFPARKALDQYRKLSGTGVTRAIGLLAQADLDIRGAKDWPEGLVIEVLVARLSKLAGGRR
ncbi:MAG: polymerase delta subunit [Actinomycetota bacterium]|jgi:DNA polymerase-3 subunit delta